MAATVWTGHLTFGLISIPIRLYSAARSERISFHQLHSVCHSRLKQPLFCPTCNRMVDRPEVVKGYETDKDQYLLFDEKEIQKITPPSARTMEILEFVKLDEVDPLHFDASYFAVPEDAGKKAYYLLVKAMEESGYAAIAKVSMHQREYTVVIRPREHGLTLHTMYYENEIRKVKEYGETDHIEIKEQEKKLAEQLIESLAAPFDAKKYEDEYQKNLKALIEAKMEGREVAEVPKPHLAPVIDLMSALKKSLSQQQAAPKKAPAREAQEAPAAAGQRRRKTSAG